MCLVVDPNARPPSSAACATRFQAFGSQFRTIPSCIGSAPGSLRRASPQNLGVCGCRKSVAGSRIRDPVTRLPRSGRRKLPTQESKGRCRRSPGRSGGWNGRTSRLKGSPRRIFLCARTSGYRSSEGKERCPCSRDFPGHFLPERHDSFHVGFSFLETAAHPGAGFEAWRRAASVHLPIPLPFHPVQPTHAAPPQ